MDKKRGRPTKLDEVVQEKIVNAIKAGNYIETAAAYAGINKDTLYEWLKRGEREKQRLRKDKNLKINKAEEPFVYFSDAVEKALAEAEMRNVLIISKTAEAQWQAAAWWLERKYPEKWGKRDNVNLTTDKDGFRIEVEYVSGRGNDNGRENKEQG